MRLAAAIRFSGALWFVPVAFALQTLMLLDQATTSGYPQSDYARAVAYALYPTGPLLAGVAAYRFSGFRRFHKMAPQLRVGVALRAYAPLIGGTALAVLVALALRVLEVPADTRTLAILVLAATVVIACGLWGLAVAWALPTILAVPLAIALPFYWIAYTPSLTGAIYKQLTPDMPCCRIDRQLSPMFMIGLGSLAFLLTVGLAACLMLRRWSVIPRIVSLGMVASVVVASIVVSVALVRVQSAPVTEAIDEPRTSNLECLSRSSQEVCVWPEQLSVADDIAREVDHLNEFLRVQGMPPVNGVNQKEPRTGQIAVRTATVGFDTENDLLLFVAAGYVAREAGCPNGLQGGTQADERVAAIALSLGWKTNPGSIPLATVGVARSELGNTPDRFMNWFYADIGLLGCSRIK